MRTVDIIEALNNVFEFNRHKGHFVSKMTIETNSISKAHKLYKIEVWYVNNGIKDLVFTIQESARVVDGNEDAILKTLNTRLLEYMLSNIDSLMRYGI